MVDKKKFEKKGYTITVTSKSLPITEAIEKYIYEKVEKFERFAKHILDVVITLDVQKLTHTVSIRMKFFHFLIKVQARTENIYSSIDKATDRLVKLIQKHKTKMQMHKVKEPITGTPEMEVSVLKPISYVEELNEQIDDETLKEEEDLYKIGEIVTTESMPVKMFTQGEAAVKLAFSDNSFLIYKSEEDQKLKFMYKREDEKLGLVDIENI